MRRPLGSSDWYERGGGPGEEKSPPTPGNSGKPPGWPGYPPAAQGRDPVNNDVITLTRYEDAVH